MWRSDSGQREIRVTVLGKEGILESRSSFVAAVRYALKEPARPGPSLSCDAVPKPQMKIDTSPFKPFSRAPTSHFYWLDYRSRKLRMDERARRQLPVAVRISGSFFAFAHEQLVRIFL
jgi:hypothetical protein